MIDVKHTMNLENPGLFIQKQGADKHAATKRLIATEDMLEDWFCTINRTNTRELPSDLVALYEQAAATISQICAYEQKIISGEKEQHHE